MYPKICENCGKLFVITEFRVNQDVCLKCFKKLPKVNASWEGWQHIIPLNDLVEHRTDLVTDSEYDTYPCICNPRLDYEYQLVIHSAMDRREVYWQEGRRNAVNTW